MPGIQIFPFLLDHLSKNDLLQCRLVCKEWCKGIDHFLENNAFHRVVFEKDHLTKSDNLVLLLSTPLKTKLKEKGLNFVNCWGMERVNKYLTHSSFHPRCPILGRSVKIMISVRTEGQLPLLIQFFQTFGHHIWFLQIGMVLRYEQAKEALSVLLDLIALVPNLKMLDINDGNLYRPRDEPPLDPEQEREMESQLSEYAVGRITDEMRQRLAKLETLRLRMNQKCSSKLNAIFLTLFCNQNLQRISLSPTPTTLKPLLPLSKLTELNLSISSDEQLNSLLELRSHKIQNLELQLSGPINILLLFQAISEFRPSLRNLGVLIQSKFYSSLSLAELPSNLQPFTDTKALRKLPLLKSVTLKGLFPSLNFLRELRDSLQCLHISNNWIDVMEGVVMKSIPGWNINMEGEMLDLLKYLNADMSSFQSNKIYQSNVWMTFPRLHLLTIGIVDRYRDERNWKYGRGIYDRISCISPPNVPI